MRNPPCMTTMTKDNMVHAQGNHLMIDAIQLAIPIAHFCESETFKGGCIGECILSWVESNVSIQQGKTNLIFIHGVACYSNECSSWNKCSIKRCPVFESFSGHEHWVITNEHVNYDKLEQNGVLLPMLFSRWDSFRKLSILHIFCIAALVHPCFCMTFSASSRISLTYSGCMAKSKREWVNVYNQYL